MAEQFLVTALGFKSTAPSECEGGALPTSLKPLIKPTSLHLQKPLNGAVAMQEHAKQAKDTTLTTQATEIRMRAERRC